MGKYFRVPLTEAVVNKGVSKVWKMCNLMEKEQSWMFVKEY
jgi:hypothetical protein